MQKVKFRSISSKLVLLVTLTTGIILLLASVAYISNNINSLRRSTESVMITGAQLIAENTTAALAFGDRRAAADVLSSLKFQEDVLSAVIYDEYGATFAIYDRDKTGFSPPAIDGDEDELIYSGDLVHLYKPIILDNEQVGLLYIESDFGRVQKIVNYSLLIAFAIFFLLVLITFFISRRIQSFISKPIIRLATNAKEIMENENYSIRANKESDDEIGELVENFNRMLDRIQIRDNALVDSKEKAEILAKQESLLVEELKHINNELKSSEEKYRSLIEGSNDVIYLIYENKFEIINQKFRELFMITDKEVMELDHGFWDLVSPSSLPLLHAREKMREVGESPPPHFEFIAKATNGKEFEVEATITELPYKDGIAIQGILRDISERKQLEEQLRQSQKMEAVGRLAGGIAHDFNNLLTVIIGNTEMALLSVEDDEKLKSDINEILSSSERAAELTKQLLAFSRKQKLNLKNVSLNEIIEDMESLLKRTIGEDIILTTILSQTPLYVRVDPRQIEQVIINLAVNARDAMLEGGYFSISTEQIILEEKLIERNLEIIPGKYVLLSFTDTGHGIPHAITEKIFEPFFSTKSEGKGTGLGLSTVYGIIRQSNGFISVYSQEGEGTVFKIYLPFVESEGDWKELPESGVRARGGDETILVVEDEKSVRNLVIKVLENMGYNLIVADSGDKALEICQSEDVKVDLVLTDVIMPGMKGPELIAKLIEKNKDLKYIFMSGYPEKAIFKHGILNSDVPYLQKPFRSNQLNLKIREELDKRKE